MVIREPEAFQLLADETRRKILYLLRVKEMNASQIAAELGVTSQAIYHHIRKLLKGKMIEIAKEERVGHLIESYYRATAEDFLLSHGKTKSETMHDKEQAKEQVTAALNTLNKVGFKLEFNTEQISKIADLRVEVHKCCSDHGEIEDKIDEKIWAQIREDKIWYKLREKIEEKIWEDIDKKFGSELREKIGDKIREKIDE